MRPSPGEAANRRSGEPGRHRTTLTHTGPTSPAGRPFFGEPGHHRSTLTHPRPTSALAPLRPGPLRRWPHFGSDRTTGRLDRPQLTPGHAAGALSPATRRTGAPPHHAHAPPPHFSGGASLLRRTGAPPHHAHAHPAHFGPRPTSDPGPLRTPAHFGPRPTSARTEPPTAARLSRGQGVK